MITIRKHNLNEELCKVEYTICKAYQMSFDDCTMIALEGVSDRGILKVYLPYRDDTSVLLGMVNSVIDIYYGVRINKDYKAVLKLFCIDF